MPLVRPLIRHVVAGLTLAILRRSCSFSWRGQHPRIPHIRRNDHHPEEKKIGTLSESGVLSTAGIVNATASSVCFHREPTFS